MKGRSFAARAGIIPACAGNTASPCQRWAGRRDHPRVCGEHSEYTPVMGEKEGSSPRVRGTLQAVEARRAQQGIIPARAGNTASSRTSRSTSRDHPRVCGEHSAQLTSAAMEQGSSPRVRGTRRPNQPNRPHAGIIPACAGNTACWFWGNLWSRDHPRVCGEHVTM